MPLRKFLLVLLTTLGLGSGLPPAAIADSSNSLATQVREKAELAVSQFQKRAGGKLDYSERSLSVVEEMLAEAAQYTSQMQPGDVKALTELMGSYILEVAYRRHGGKFEWHEGRNQPVLVVGAPKFRVALMTFDKVKGRLSGDKADNIVFFYEGFATRLKSAAPGANVLYV